MKVIHRAQAQIFNLGGVSNNKMSFSMDSSFCAHCMSGYLTELSDTIES